MLFTPFPARALRRALCVHCQNTRTRPAPPSCSEPWCCAVLAAAVCLLVSLCARSWNTIVSLKGPCSISRYLQIFWEYCLQKSCLLVFWLSCSVAWNACRICMFACKSVCMYVCTYLLKHRFALESIYIEIFLDSSQTVCFQLQLGTRVCFYSARTVHAQCTATVHGLETLQIPQKMAPRLQNIEKTGCRIFF